MVVVVVIVTATRQWEVVMWCLSWEDGDQCFWRVGILPIITRDGVDYDTVFVMAMW